MIPHQLGNGNRELFQPAGLCETWKVAKLQAALILSVLKVGSKKHRPRSARRPVLPVDTRQNVFREVNVSEATSLLAGRPDQ